VTRPTAEEDAIQLFTIPSNGSETHIDRNMTSESRNSHHLSSASGSMMKDPAHSFSSEITGGISKTVEFRIYESKDAQQ
jgi:hypothetical protein